MIGAWRTIADASRRASEAFAAAMENPGAAQRALLKRILAANETSRFGRHHGFATIDGPDAYRRAVPIRSHEAFEPHFQAVARGADQELTAEPVLLFEETGGSTGGAKLIPYTESALRAFRHALLPWLADCLSERPALGRGRAYWAISPARHQTRRTPGGIPIGVDSDGVYFGPEMAPAFAALSVAGQRVACAPSFAAWRHATALDLLRAHDLALISIWSPTFFFPILETISQSADALLRDIAEGRLRDPQTGAPLPGDGEAPADPERAAFLAGQIDRDPVPTDRIWPGLDMISCWADAGARTFAELLEQRFPRVKMQGKGLLASEGVITIPLHRHPYPVPALTSGFIEFADDSGVTGLCDELSEGEAYRVIMTTPGGLYRYDIGDRLRMRGWAKPGLPMLEFVGRASDTSDLCGEKLTAEFVEQCLRPIRGFRQVIADATSTPPSYVLLLDAADVTADRALALVRQVEAALRENPQYRYARNLRQLGPLRVKRAHRPLEAWMTTGLGQGRRLGDVKPASLAREAWLPVDLEINEEPGGIPKCASC